MHHHDTLIREFYAAFARKDFAAMQGMYHDEASFSDPVFPDMNSIEVRAMWQMLITSGKDLKVTCGDVKTDGTKGSCHWEAWYTFSRTGRPVHNRIDATFEFKEGKILRHTDRFDFWNWSRQALGLPGLLLGWTPVIRDKVRGTARDSLKKFMGVTKT
jgi:ketosteroid isomerase-like protein